MIKGRIKSIGHALNGFRISLKEELNLRIHLFVAVCVLFAGVFFQISKVEWIVVVLSIGWVISVELLNTSLENLCDHITIEEHPAIKKIKDISAAAVLTTAISAAVAGLIIFIPHIIRLVV